MKVNRVELAEILGVSTATVSRRVKQGMPTVVHPKAAGEEWQFDSATVIEWLVQGPEAYWLPQQIEEATTRRKVAKAGLSELELGERHGVLFDIEDVSIQFTEQLAVVKAHLMTLPGRLAHEMALTSDPEKVRQLLAEDLEEAASEFTGFDSVAGR